MTIVERIEAALICRPIPPELLREAADEIARLRAQVDDFGDLLKQDAIEIARLRAALQELADLMQGVIDGDYKPDSFTLQPSRRALEPKP